TMERHTHGQHLRLESLLYGFRQVTPHFGRIVKRTLLKNDAFLCPPVLESDNHCEGPVSPPVPAARRHCTRVQRHRLCQDKRRAVLRACRREKGTFARFAALSCLRVLLNLEPSDLRASRSGLEADRGANPAVEG